MGNGPGCDSEVSGYVMQFIEVFVHILHFDVIDSNLALTSCHVFWILQTLIELRQRRQHLYDLICLKWCWWRIYHLNWFISCLMTQRRLASLNGCLLILIAVWVSSESVATASPTPHSKRYACCVVSPHTGTHCVVIKYTCSHAWGFAI